MPVIVKCVSGLTLLAALGAACAVEPGRSDPVGRRPFAYADPVRASWSGEGPRPISTMVWYPAATSSREHEWRIGGLPFAPLFRAGWAALDAELEPGDERFPLIVLSHGTGGAAAQLAWLAEGLAARGAIVAAINHHGSTAVEPYTPHGFVLWWERATDVSAVIDRLLADPEFGPRIDPARIGAAGFSAGGAAVLSLVGARAGFQREGDFCLRNPSDSNCVLPPESPFSEEEFETAWRTREFQESLGREGESFQDARVQAVYSMAPGAGPNLVPESLATIERPVRIVVGETDDQAGSKVNAGPISQRIPDAELWVIPAAGHYVFLAECGALGKVALPSLCRDASGVNRSELHAKVVEDAARYFDGVFGAGPR